MDPIQVSGPDARTLDRRAFERARSQVLAEHDPTLPICAAAASSLVLDADGAVRVCEAASLTLSDRAPGDLAELWRGDARRTLCAAHARAELPGEHCQGCVRMLAAHIIEGSPMLRDHGYRPNEGDAGPGRLLLRLDRGRDEADPAATVARLRGVLRSLQVLELSAADPFVWPETEQVLDLLRQLPEAERPSLWLRIEQVTDPERAAELLEGLSLGRVTLSSGPSMEAAADFVKPRMAEAAELCVRFVPGPDNWFDLYRSAQRAAAVGAKLQPRAITADLDCPLTRLPIEEQRLVLGVFSSDWSLFGAPDRPVSLEASEYSAFCSEARRVIQDHAQRQAQVDAGQVVQGGAAVLAMPPLDHPMLVEEAAVRRWVGWFFGLQRGRGLCEWAGGLVDDDSAWQVAAQRPWLRALLQKAAVLEPRRDLFDRLAALYVADGKALLSAEREFAATIPGSAASLADLRDWLHIERVGDREPPFAVDALPPLEGEERPDLTVLIPSYKHAAYIGDCLRSVLAQSYRNFVVRVVDDRSPDQTVECAREVEDPRVAVGVNERNLGLGNSVLAALDSIDTPFVALLNSDDLFHPDRLAACRDALLADEGAQVVATGLSLIDEHGGELTLDNVTPLIDGRNIFDWVNWYENARPEDVDSEAMFAELLQHNFLATSTNLVCRTDFLRAQADALRSLRYCLDWHLFLVASMRGVLRYLPDRLAAYRLHRSNTVWFDEERRWGYFLEVNRVAAEVLREAADRDVPDSGARAIELALNHLRLNTEVNPLALYLNELEGGFKLAELSAKNPEVAARIQELNELAERGTKLNYAVADYDAEELESHLLAMRRLDELEVLAVIAQIEQDEGAVLRGGVEWARDRVDALEERLGERNRQIDKRNQQIRARERQVSELDALVNRSRDRSEQILDLIEEAVRDQLPERREDLQLEGQLVRIENASRWLAQFARERLSLQSRIESTRTRIEELQKELDAIRRAKQEQVEIGEALRQELKAARDEHQRRVAEFERRQKGLERDLAGVRGDLRDARQQIETMLGSMEWRIGRAIWQKTPFFAKTRRAVRAAYRRTRESMRRARAGMRKRLQKPSDQLKIAAASTAQFPVISHTFVYQELTALHEMLGADVRLFCKERVDGAALHAAFTYLGENSDLVPGAWEVHKADYEHYRRQRPEHVQALMADLEAASGLSIEELERDFSLMHAFSFARRMEEWGADYVQSYFFYDAALSALVASRVLDIPRGVSTYADHMMDDWPLKVVALHLRDADVIVATSRRIKRELVGIGGAEIADKVVVKPNGVNGERFPFVQREAVIDRPLETIVVSRIEPKKGMVELAESVKLLRDSGHALRVHLIGSADPGCVGSEEYAEQLHGRIAELGVGDSFVFHGALLQEQIRPLLDKADLFVAPFVETATGDKDGIPTAILEAMSTGLPVVGTDAGSIPEIFDDGVEGFIVGQRDVEAFADAVERFFAEPALAPKMGKLARERFVKEFDTRATEPRFHERVKRALAERQARKSAEG